MRLTDDVLEALSRLEHNPDFQAFIEHIRVEREETRESLVRVSDHHHMLRLQGSAQALGELLQQVEEASAALLSRRNNRAPLLG